MEKAHLFPSNALPNTKNPEPVSPFVKADSMSMTKIHPVPPPLRAYSCCRL